MTNFDSDKAAFSDGKTFAEKFLTNSSFDFDLHILFSQSGAKRALQKSLLCPLHYIIFLLANKISCFLIATTFGKRKKNLCSTWTNVVPDSQLYQSSA